MAFALGDAQRSALCTAAGDHAGRRTRLRLPAQMPADTPSIIMGRRSHAAARGLGGGASARRRRRETSTRTRSATAPAQMPSRRAIAAPVDALLEVRVAPRAARGHGRRRASVTRVADVAARGRIGDRAGDPRPSCAPSPAPTPRVAGGLCARDAASTARPRATHPTHWLICAQVCGDQVVTFEGRVREKPADLDERAALRPELFR